MAAVFRRARPDDVARIAEIYGRIHDLEERGLLSTGWKREIYPTAMTAESSIAKGDMFVEEVDGVVVAAAKLNREQVHPEYDRTPWKYEAGPEEVMVIHTLVVDPEMSRKGYGKSFIGYYEQYAGEQGCTTLRMDTNARNHAARSLYGKLGYREAAVLPCSFNGIPGVELVCLEKSLK